MDKLLVNLGWQYIEEGGTVWTVGERVTWEEPIGGGGYVTVVGIIYGFDHEEETARVYVETPFIGDMMEVRLTHLEKVAR